MRKLFVFLVFVVYGFAAQLNVAAAANTTYAFDEIKAEFAKLYPEAQLNVSLGSSGKLVTQIENGAPFDIFMSADMNFASRLYKKGIAKDEPKVYAKGKLAMLSVRGFNLGKGLEVLGDKNIKTIIIANAQTAPYGTASVEALKNAKIYDGIKNKIIQAGSIGEALSQTLKAGDIGFVAASAMFSPKMANYKEGENFVLVDSGLYSPISQGIVIIKQPNQTDLAQKFYDFILSDKGREIFEKYGYGF